MAESLLRGARCAYPIPFGGKYSGWRYTDMIRPEAPQRVYWTMVSIALVFTVCPAGHLPLPSATLNSPKPVVKVGQ
jgi:hypothetical protein